MPDLMESPVAGHHRPSAPAARDCRRWYGTGEFVRESENIGAYRTRPFKPPLPVHVLLGPGAR
eukprot:1134044-Rhodomonas_salina.1